MRRVISDYFALAGKVLGGIAEAEGRIEERKTGIESPNYRGFSRLARRDYKGKRNEGDACKILRCTVAAAESTFAPARCWRYKARWSPRGRNSIAQEDLTLCIVHWIYLKGTQMRAHNGFKNSKHRHCVFANNLIFTRQSFIILNCFYINSNYIRIQNYISF